MWCVSELQMKKRRSKNKNNILTTYEVTMKFEVLITFYPWNFVFSPKYVNSKKVRGQSTGYAVKKLHFSRSGCLQITLGWQIGEIWDRERRVRPSEVLVLFLHTNEFYEHLDESWQSLNKFLQNLTVLTSLDQSQWIGILMSVQLKYASEYERSLYETLQNLNEFPRVLKRSSN